MRSRLVATMLLVALLAPQSVRAARVSLDALDLIALEIAYTTLMARYYKPVSPRTLVDGARTGIAAELIARGIANAPLPFTPPHVSFGDGEDAISALVLQTLARYGTRLDGHALVAAAIAGELASLHDPYSLVFRPQAFKKFNAFLGNRAFGGIGAVVSFDRAAGRAAVEGVLPDSPAAKSGIAAGDAIVAVDGKTVASFSDASALLAALRGTIGSRVSIDVAGPAGTARRLVLTRVSVRDPEVRTARFGDDAYIRLARFGDAAAADVRAAVAAASTSGARGIVLDLRGNGGGYGDEATGVASVFVGTQPVFTTRERGGAPSVAHGTTAAAGHTPLVVLVDGDTASAAEIVAGALQDYGIATVVGARTFGKGLVQSVYPLPDGSAVKLTTARYTTPKGRDIDRVGITPDRLVAQPAGSIVGDPATDPQLAAALALLGALPAERSGLR